MSLPMDPRFDNFLAAYERLNQSIRRSLRTQLGDEGRLVEKQEEVRRFLASAEQVCN